MDPALVQDIFRINDHRTFRETALKVFYFQAEQCAVYRHYLEQLGKDPDRVTEPDQIPFLPIEFFKTHRVLHEGSDPELEFFSSGTTGSDPSRHVVAYSALYRESFLRGFTRFYGDPSAYCILALLPSYLERKGSSLVYMTDHLIRQSGVSESGFYLDNLEDLVEVLVNNRESGQKTLLIGVTFALLELARRFPVELGKHTILMETGGMKGRGKELVRSELHEILTRAFSLSTIHSEYGMTELLSQAYSTGNGRFYTPPWLKVLIRDVNDPLTFEEPGKTGGINLIDLANLYSCSFIATGDLGRIFPDGSFEVLGRFDQSDIRGCNLLVS